MGNNANDNDFKWYHGNMSRRFAKDLLLRDPDVENGLFLVRTSGTSPGDYVLSVVFNGDVVHYQIRKHGEDAFFSIDDETTIHGLETLIEYYQEDARGLVTKLTKPIKGQAPPHETRRHGNTNLLHRATLQNNYCIVSELVKCGDRNLDAKNQVGQTAVHLAAIDGLKEILEKLIESNASVNCRDTAGYTPLHYACQGNFPEIVEILIAGGANIQARHTKTGMVPLHEAADKGYQEIVKILLKHNAPVNPRTVADEVPADLAKKNGHTECEQFLCNYDRPTNEKKSSWYHGTLDRMEAIHLLNESGGKDGSFLVRRSDRHDGIYVLTVLYGGQTFNFQIQKMKLGHFLFIDNGPYLPSLEHVIDHYRRMPDGLPGPLIHAVAPIPKPPVPEMPPSIFNGDTLRKKKESLSKSVLEAAFPAPTSSCNIDDEIDIKIEDNQDLHCAVPAIIESDNETPMPESEGIIIKKSDSTAFTPGENLILGEVLGEGEFGAVHEGLYITPSGTQQPVAIKMLRDKTSPSTREEFLREARLMMSFDHHCIVKMIGFSEGPPLLMVQELVPLGSMLAYLLEFPDRVSPNYELKIWATHIACGEFQQWFNLNFEHSMMNFTLHPLGMKYLEDIRLVHRDLAARNILLASRTQAKISDFGLSRTFGNNDYYKATAGGKWPIKWYAPESFNYGAFSTASDVWSYGVTLWEMFSYGEQPYGDMKGTEVIEFIERGERLPQTEKCPDYVYHVMLRCWNLRISERPTFKELMDIFSNDPEYANLNDLAMLENLS
uniref:Tyrosine-protein kinase n=1 Tax=Trichogramma kaykai TaxID=54128 RepID=A0ABD2XPA8_9HYME